MAKLAIVAGATSQSINIFVQDSSSTVGAGLTGLTGTTANLIAYYTFTGTNTGSVAISTSTLAAVNSAYSSGGMKEIDSTNMKGLYRFDLPNAALATSKGRVVTVILSGATNMAPCVLEIELTGWDNQNATTGGLSALPNAAAGANGGLPTVDANGSVSCRGNIKKNTALAGFAFLMTDSTNHNPKTGLTVSCTRSIDAGAFSATTNSPAELANGIYNLSLSAGDLNGNTIVLRCTATNADDTFVIINTYV